MKADKMSRACSAHGADKTGTKCLVSPKAKDHSEDLDRDG